MPSIMIDLPSSSEDRNTAGTGRSIANDSISFEACTSVQVYPLPNFGIVMSPLSHLS